MIDVARRPRADSLSGDRTILVGTFGIDHRRRSHPPPTAWWTLTRSLETAALLEARNPELSAASAARRGHIGRNADRKRKFRLGDVSRLGKFLIQRRGWLSDQHRERVYRLRQLALECSDLAARGLDIRTRLLHAEIGRQSRVSAKLGRRYLEGRIAKLRNTAAPTANT